MAQVPCLPDRMYHAVSPMLHCLYSSNSATLAALAGNDSNDDDDDDDDDVDDDDEDDVATKQPATKKARNSRSGSSSGD